MSLMWGSEVICLTNPWNFGNRDISVIFDENIAKQLVTDMIHKEPRVRKAACEILSNLLTQHSRISAAISGVQLQFTNTLIEALQQEDTLGYCLSIATNLTFIWPSWNLQMVNEESYHPLLEAIWKVHENLKLFRDGLAIIGNICHDSPQSSHRFVFQRDAMKILSKFHLYILNRFRKWEDQMEGEVYDTDMKECDWTQKSPEITQIIGVGRQLAWVLRMFVTKNKSRHINENKTLVIVKTLRLLTYLCFIPSLYIYESMVAAFESNHVIQLLPILCAKKMVARLMVPIRYVWPIIFRLATIKALIKFLTEWKNDDRCYQVIDKHILDDIFAISPRKTLNICDNMSDAVKIIQHTTLFGLKMFRAHGFLTNYAINYCQKTIELDVYTLGYSAVGALCQIARSGNERHSLKLLRCDVFETITEAYDVYGEDMNHRIDDSVFNLLWG